MKSTSRLTSEMVAEVMVQGRALKSGPFLFKYLVKNGLKSAYFGFIASKKNFPTAAERNRVRRRGRAALRCCLSSNITPCLGAFMLAKEALVVDFGALSYEIEHALIKSGILVK